RSDEPDTKRSISVQVRSTGGARTISIRSSTHESSSSSSKRVVELRRNRSLDHDEGKSKPRSNGAPSRARIQRVFPRESRPWAADGGAGPVGGARPRLPLENTLN